MKENDWQCLFAAKKKYRKLILCSFYIIITDLALCEHLSLSLSQFLFLSPHVLQGPLVFHLVSNASFFRFKQAMFIFFAIIYLFFHLDLQPKMVSFLYNLEK